MQLFQWILVKSITVKATDLKYPHAWEERKPAVHAGVLFVPKYYSAHAWTAPLCAEEKKILIEYCSGNGAWVLQKAQEDPSKQWIAVEQRFERVRKIWSKRENLALSNLLIVCGEARTFTTFYLPDASVDEVYINFPDPWPKAKHAKNRLIQESFVRELFRVLKPGATVTIVTDHVPYCLHIIEALSKDGLFSPCFVHPHFVHEWPNYGISYFDSLWRSKGMKIHYMVFKKC